jgi:hypothetical protein
MHKRGLVEGGVFLVVGLVGMTDAVRLIVYKNPRSIEDLTGPGRYLFVISCLITVVAVLYLISQYRERPPLALAANKESRSKAISTVLVLALYIALIDIVGYAWSTPIFFVLILRVFGVKSWVSTAVLSLTMSIAYYVIFVRLFEMPFPRGLMFS